MTERISWEQERKIVWGFLDGMTDDEILGFADVSSKSTVHKYIDKYKEFRKDHTEEEALEEWDLVEEFEDLRGLSLLLKKENLTLGDASAGLRVVTKARSLKLHEDQINGFIDDYSSYVSKNDLDPEELFESEREVVDLGKKWGIKPKDVVIRVEQLKAQVTSLEQRKKSLESQAAKAKEELDLQLNRNQATLEQNKRDFESQMAKAKEELDQRLEDSEFTLEELDEFEADNDALEERGLHPRDRKKLVNILSNLAESEDIGSLLKVAESVRSLRSETSKLQIRKRRLEEAVNQLSKKEGALGETVKQEETTIAGQKGEEEELKRRIAKLQTQNNEFIPVIKQVMEGVKSLEGGIERDTALMVLEVEPENLSLHHAAHFMERMGKWFTAYCMKDPKLLPSIPFAHNLVDVLAKKDSQETSKETAAEAARMMSRPTWTTEPLTGGDYTPALSRGMAVVDGSIILRRAHEQPALVDQNSNLNRKLAETEKAIGETVERHRQETEALNGRIRGMEEAHALEIRGRDDRMGQLEVLVGERDTEIERWRTENGGLREDLARRDEAVLEGLEFKALVEKGVAEKHDEWYKNQRHTEVHNEAVLLITLASQAILGNEPPIEGLTREIYETMRMQINQAAVRLKDKTFNELVERQSEERSRIKAEERL